MDHAVRSTFTVRSYEVDSYAHLNNGVYVSWFEQARLDYLQSLGFSYDGFADRREWFVVAHLDVDFRAPLRTGEDVVIESRIVRLGRSSVRWRQVMMPGVAESTSAAADAVASAAESRGAAEADVAGRAGVVAEASAVMVFHGEDGRSIEIPADFRTAVESGRAPDTISP